MAFKNGLNTLHGVQLSCLYFWSSDGVLESAGRYAEIRSGVLQAVAGHTRRS